MQYVKPNFALKRQCFLLTPGPFSLVKLKNRSGIFELLPWSTYLVLVHVLHCTKWSLKLSLRLNSFSLVAEHNNRSNWTFILFLCLKRQFLNINFLLMKFNAILHLHSAVFLLTHKLTVHTAPVLSQLSSRPPPGGCYRAQSVHDSVLESFPVRRSPTLKEERV